MIDLSTARSKFETAMHQHDSGTRTQLLRILELLEVLLASESDELLKLYAPKLIERAAGLVKEMSVDEIAIGIAERFTPVLWKIAIEYPEVERKETALFVLDELRWKYDRSKILQKELSMPSPP